MRDYKNTACKLQRKIYNSLNKYGFQNHICEIIHSLPCDISQDILDEYEVIYISFYKEAGFALLNIKEGGKHGTHSEETREILRKKNKNRPPITEETRKKMSESGKARPKKGKMPIYFGGAIRERMKGNNHGKGNKGAFRSEEYREKIRQANLGKITPEEVKEKLRKAKRSQEVIEIVRKKVTGRKMNPEQIERIRQGLYKSWAARRNKLAKVNL